MAMKTVQLVRLDPDLERALGNDGEYKDALVHGDWVRVAHVVHRHVATTVRRILAHTLPEANASTRVLEKAGMTFVGEVIDPEDGRVWRWQVPVAA